jgi:hypothetical protein
MKTAIPREGNNMEKRHVRLHRGDWIILSGLLIFLLMTFFMALLLDASSGIVKTNNPVAKFALALGFQKINSSGPAWILLIVICLYLFLTCLAVILEVRTAQFYDKVVWDKKRATIYSLTVLGGSILGFGIGSAAQYPFTVEYFQNSFLFLGESMLISLIFCIIIFLLIAAIYLFIHNIFAYHKKQNVESDSESESPAGDDKEPSLNEESHSLAASFSGVNSKNAVEVMANHDATALEESEKRKFDKEKVFPGLCQIDYDEVARQDEKKDDSLTLNEIATGFRNYLAKNLSLYFSISTIRGFIAGLSASRLLILEGLSGTGKTSLARYWSDYIGEESFFVPVQANWRDRTSLLGYFNDFSSSYHETEFLKRLYRYGYRPHDMNIMVLDEVNISRIEYYFADFLSIMEYPKDNWKLKIIELPLNATAPAHLDDGIISIPESTWFVGTANTDDSTFTITDKVIDRAIVINFDERNEPFDVKGEAKATSLSFEYLTSLFNKANEKEEYRFNDADYKKFKGLLDFFYNEFGIAIGNRVINQISLFVPTYMACGGKKNEAIDFIFSSKIVSKLEGRYEEQVRSGLLSLSKKCSDLYGEDFANTNRLIKRLIRKLA